MVCFYDNNNYKEQPVYNNHVGPIIIHILLHDEESINELKHQGKLFINVINSDLFISETIKLFNTIRENVFGKSVTNCTPHFEHPYLPYYTSVIHYGAV